MTQSQYDLVLARRITCTKWADTYTFYNPVEEFDAVKVLNLYFRTPTTGNLTMEFAITSHPDFNKKSSNVNPAGEIYFHMLQVILDPRAEAAIYHENSNPITNLENKINQLAQIKYEITINNVPNDPDIDASNPVYVELGFFKRIR